MDVFGKVLDRVLVVFGIVPALDVAEALFHSLLQIFTLGFVLIEEPFHRFPDQPLRARIVPASDPRPDQLLKFSLQLDGHSTHPRFRFYYADGCVTTNRSTVAPLVAAIYALLVTADFVAPAIAAGERHTESLD